MNQNDTNACLIKPGVEPFVYCPLKGTLCALCGDARLNGKQLDRAKQAMLVVKTAFFIAKRKAAWLESRTGFAL